MPSNSRIFEGKTLEDAVRKGLEEFRLTRAEVMITTMEEGSGGFFGIGARPYRVRMQPRPGGAPRDIEERGARGGDRERGGRGGERERGGRGGDRQRGGRGGERERGGRGGERGGRGERAPRQPVRAEGGRGARGGERGERPAGPGDARREPPVARTEPPRGGERERGRGRDRGERGERREKAEPRAQQPPVVEEIQPTLGARGFEDRRRPGDRREDEGPPPGGLEERRSGDDRRQVEGAGGAGGEGDARRRRRRGRRGGRGRRRGGAEVIAAIESAMPPAGPATAEAMASDLPTEFGAHEPEGHIEPMPAPPPAAFEPPASPPVSFPPPAPFSQPEWNPPAPPAETFAAREPAMAPREEHRPSRGGEAQGPALSAEELRDTSQRVTEELFKAMGFVGKVSATLAGPDKVEVVVEVSDDEELLTGRKGETRQALQHLLNRMVNKGEGSRYHLQLEINDFWKRREQELAEQARKMADDATTTGHEQVTEFLNAQERRIIHVTLREDTRVKTYALGDGMIKRLAVAPAHAETMGGES